MLAGRLVGWLVRSFVLLVDCLFGGAAAAVGVNIVGGVDLVAVVVVIVSVRWLSLLLFLLLLSSLLLSLLFVCSFVHSLVCVYIYIYIYMIVLLSDGLRLLPLLLLLL